MDATRMEAHRAQAQNRTNRGQQEFPNDLASRLTKPALTIYLHLYRTMEAVHTYADPIGEEKSLCVAKPTVIDHLYPPQ